MLILEPATLCLMNPSVASKQAIKQAIKQALKELMTGQWPALTQANLNYNISSNTAQHPSPEGPQFLSR